MRLSENRKRGMRRREEGEGNRIEERNERAVGGLRKAGKKKIDDDRGNRESGKVRYRTTTSRVNGRLLVVVHFVEEGLAGEGAAGSVGYVLAHVRNCGHLSRKREAEEEGNLGGEWREIAIRVRGEVEGRERGNFELWRGRLASQSRLNVQCITGLRRRRISPSDSKRRYEGVADRDSPRSSI